MKYHYRNSPTDELKIRMCRGQIDRKGNLLEYVRKEKIFIEKRRMQKELGMTK